MSDEATVEEAAKEPVEAPVENAKAEAPSEDKNREKYRLISGEDILENGEARPSTLAFLGMYVLGLVVFGVHLFFNSPPTPADDAPFLTKLAANLIEWTNWDSLPLGFVFLMCFITWANRMLNISTSGKWVTVALLFITFLPIIISVDNLISNILNLFSSTDTTYNFIPIDNYNFFISGLLFLMLSGDSPTSISEVFSYARRPTPSFSSTFLLSRSHRRILFDRISEVMVERTPMGTMLGYATVTIMTDSGVGLVEESVGVGAGAGGNVPGPRPQQTMALLQSQQGLVPFHVRLHLLPANHPPS